MQRIEAQGVECTVRDTQGQKIAAACGQLAAEGCFTPTMSAVNGAERRPFCPA